MARKDLLKGLLAGGPALEDGPAGNGLTGDAPAGGGPAEVVPLPRPPAPARNLAKGAIGAVSRSIADLKARSVLEIDPHLIDAGGLKDRLEHDPVADAELARSIGEYGQQVPVLVRPSPGRDGRWQVVYGRRRVLALRNLGQPVKALVRDLDDRELVLAQGQENTARRDLSFIEKTNFARQMAEAGYDRKVICDALSIDKTVISRMLSVAERIPVEVIEAVGSAPGVGRDRWLAVADRFGRRDEGGRHGSGPALERLLVAFKGVSPDERFDALEASLQPGGTAPDPRTGGSGPGIHPGRSEPGVGPDRPPAGPAPRLVRGAGGAPLGSARSTPKALVLRLDRTQGQGFEEWLLDRLPEIHRDWLALAGDRRGG